MKWNFYVLIYSCLINELPAKTKPQQQFVTKHIAQNARTNSIHLTLHKAGSLKITIRALIDANAEQQYIGANASLRDYLLSNSSDKSRRCNETFEKRSTHHRIPPSTPPHPPPPTIRQTRVNYEPQSSIRFLPWSPWLNPSAIWPSTGVTDEEYAPVWRRGWKRLCGGRG